MSFCQTRGAPFYAPEDTNFDDRDCIFVPESSGLAGVTCFHFLFLYIIDIIVLNIISLLLRVSVSCPSAFSREIRTQFVIDQSRLAAQLVYFPVLLVLFLVSAGIHKKYNRKSPNVILVKRPFCSCRLVVAFPRRIMVSRITFFQMTGNLNHAMTINMRPFRFY